MKVTITLDNVQSNDDIKYRLDELADIIDISSSNSYIIKIDK